MFSVEQRERVRDYVLELAREDGRVVAGALVGAEADGMADRWSDLDLTFGVREDANVSEVLADWTRELVSALNAVALFDLVVGRAVYRVFLLPGNLQVDVSLAPASGFGARGPRFKLLFGTALEQPPAQPRSPQESFGHAVHHALRARVCIERGRIWQAEYWISALRDEGLALACRARGLQDAYGRGFDRLPPDLLRTFEAALVTSLQRSELLRALGAALEALLSQSDEARAIADKVEAQLRELTAPHLDR